MIQIKKDSDWETSVAALVQNIRKYIKYARAADITGMSKQNLMQCVSTRGVHLTGPNPQNLFARAFDEALGQIKDKAILVNSGFVIY